MYAPGTAGHSATTVANSTETWKSNHTTCVVPPPRVTIADALV